MAWKRAEFEVQTTEGKVAVSGITRKGLGIYLVDAHPDGERGVFHLVHLRSGLAFLITATGTATTGTAVPGDQMATMNRLCTWVKGM